MENVASSTDVLCEFLEAQLEIVWIVQYIIYFMNAVEKVLCYLTDACLIGAAALVKAEHVGTASGDSRAHTAVVIQVFTAEPPGSAGDTYRCCYFQLS